MHTALNSVPISSGAVRRWSWRARTRRLVGASLRQGAGAELQTQRVEEGALADDGGGLGARASRGGGEGGEVGVDGEIGFAR